MFTSSNIKKINHNNYPIDEEPTICEKLSLPFTEFNIYKNIYNFPAVLY